MRFFKSILALSALLLLAVIAFALIANLTMGRSMPVPNSSPEFYSLREAQQRTEVELELAQLKSEYGPDHPAVRAKEQELSLIKPKFQPQPSEPNQIRLGNAIIPGDLLGQVIQQPAPTAGPATPSSVSAARTHSIITLNTIRATDCNEIALMCLDSQESKALVDERSNSIVLRATEEEIKRTKEVLEQLDKLPKRDWNEAGTDSKLTMVPLRYVRAEQLKPMLTSLFKSPEILISCEPTTNTLVVFAPPEDGAKVIEMANSFDDQAYKQLERRKEEAEARNSAEISVEGIAPAEVFAPAEEKK